MLFHNIDNHWLSVDLEPVRDSLQALLRTVRGKFLLMYLNFEGRLGQNLVDREANVDKRQKMQRAVLADAIDGDSGFLQVLNCVDCLELTFDCQTHEVDHALSVARAVVVELLSFEVEAEGGET